MDSEGTKEETRGGPTEGTHRQVVGSALVPSELGAKVSEGEEGAEAVEAFLVFSVTAFDLAVVSGGIGADQLMTDAMSAGDGFKQCFAMAVAVAEAVGELEAVVGLDTFHVHPQSGEEGNRGGEELCGGEGALFVICSQAAHSGELVNGGVLEQVEFGVGDAVAWHDFDIDLDAFAGVGHLLVRLGRILGLGFGRGKHAQFSHRPIQGFRTSGVASHSHPVP